MKIKYGLILAVTLSTGVTAQVASNVPPSVPGTDAPPAVTATAPADAATPAPTKKAHRLSAGAKKKIERPVVREDEPPREPFATNDLAVVKAKSVNVRGQANINSEIVTQLKEGDTVTVLGEVKLIHPKEDEPSTWVRVSLPPDTHVWVNSTFVDSNHIVIPRKLNVRSGPGENYSVLGLVYKGAEIKPVGSKGDWAEIEAPTNSYAFVAAHLLGKKEAPAPVVVPVAVETPSTPPVEPVVTPPVPQPEPVPAPTPAVVDTKAAIAPPPSNPPAVETNNATVTPPTTAVVTPPAPVPAPETNAPAPPKPTEPPPVVPTPAVTAPTPVVPPVAAETPPPKRIVTREGIVGDMVSIQAPSHFKLESLETGKAMDYLYSTNSSIILKKYLGKTVLVTGEEGLDERWENTPVLTVQKIQPVE